MDFEIAHINLSFNSKEKEEENAKGLADRKPQEADNTPVVDWHTDSYPFVCVLMMSDCTEMTGGETALRTGNGDIMKVRGPGMVR